MRLVDRVTLFDFRDNEKLVIRGFAEIDAFDGAGINDGRVSAGV